MGGKGAKAAISGELDRVKKREGGRRKGKERERLFDTEDKLRLLALPPSVGRKDEKLAFTALTRMTRPCSHII